MIDETHSFALACRDSSGERPVLAGVSAAARLDGVLFELTLRQTYRNDSARVLEVVYTFPLPHQAVMLGFATELNGERMVGAIAPKQQAARQYEEALAEGDAPVMLEANTSGVHTANIGNLKPGEQIVLEVRFAQLLRFEQGRLRIAIPTTIAPRYGSALQAGLEPQQVPEASITAEYPLTLSVVVARSVGACSVECPTHPVRRSEVEGGLQLEFASTAWLDRDVVVVVTPREARPSLLVRAADAVSQTAPAVLMAALQPAAGAQRNGVAVKLLVDCSGSMGSDSIASARRALHGVLEGLQDADVVGFSRFGSSVEHVLVPSECSARTLRYLRPLVDLTEASLGGTEMEGALRAVFGLAVDSRFGNADVLLITDGEIWQTQEMVTAARASNHRVFVIGVGSSPAEAVLRSLAEATGGACEFATPGEALEAAALRMLGRMRQQPWRDVRIDWGVPTEWQSPLPTGVFAGDTVIAFAGIAGAAPATTVRLSAIDIAGNATELARSEASAPAPGDSLPRIAAAGRMTLASESEATRIALDYQLMSAQTNCVLVHRRAEADKTTEAAELHRVSSMLAAGWGATSTTFSASEHVAMAMPTVSRVRAVTASAVRFSTSFDLMDSVGDAIPEFLHIEPVDPQPASLEEIALAVGQHLSSTGHLGGLAQHCETLTLDDDVLEAVAAVSELGVGRDHAWLLLAHWANCRTQGLCDSRVARLIAPALDALDTTVVAQALAAFENLLGNRSVTRHSTSRANRLQTAMRRSAT